MSATREFSVDLPADIAESMERVVRSGAYASVNEMMTDGVHAVLEREDALERWLFDEVAAGHAEYLADPVTAVPADQVLERLVARHNAAAKS